MSNPAYPRRFTLANLELIHWIDGVVTISFEVEPSPVSLYFHAEQDATTPDGWKFTHHFYDAEYYVSTARDEFIRLLNDLMLTPWTEPTDGSCKGRRLKIDRMSTNLDA